MEILMMHIKRKIPGILICLLIAVPAWFLGKTFPIMGGPVFGILIGIIIANILPRLLSNRSNFNSINLLSLSGMYDDGVKYTSKYLLQYSIILLGFEMNLFNVIKIGSQSLIVMVFTLSASFLTAFLIGKYLKLNGKLSMLIGCGTSICGGSAIAATAPVIQAKDEDVAHAISTIFLFNIIAVFVFPPLGHFWGMSDTGFGTWAGTAINDTSSVVAAGASWSASAGNNTALSVATIVKLTRTIMIVPITLLFALTTVRTGKDNKDDNVYHFSRIFPWFVIGFVAVAVINTFTTIPPQISNGLFTTGKFIITMAMVAIGLNTHLGKLVSNGYKPILLGLCCWFSVISVSLLIQFFTNIW